MRGYVNTSHGQVHYIESGSGRAVVMLHMTPSSSWDYGVTVPLLGTQYRAIAMDTLGYGQSDKPARRYELEDYAHSVIEVLDALQIKQAALVGHATGAVIAAEVAAGQPSRVHTLVLVDYPLYSRHMLSERKHAEVYVPNVEPLRLDTSGSYMIATVDYARTFLGPEASLEEVHEMALSVLASGPRNDAAHQALWRYLDRGRALERLPQIKCPTLLVSCVKIAAFRARRFDASVPDDQVDQMLDAQLQQLTHLVPRHTVMRMGNDVPAPLLSRGSPKLFADLVGGFIATSMGECGMQ